jgi:hypothetical protein
MNTNVIDGLLDVLRKAGYRIGWMTTLESGTGALSHTVQAVNSETGESWSVTAADEYDAWIELAIQVASPLQQQDVH